MAHKEGPEGKELIGISTYFWFNALPERAHRYIPTHRRARKQNSKQTGKHLWRLCSEKERHREKSEMEMDWQKERKGRAWKSSAGQPNRKYSKDANSFVP